MSPVLVEIVIGVHIAAGLTAAVCGAAAMPAPKRRGRHPRRGVLYLAALAVLVATAIGIAFARPHTAYLLILGALALSAAPPLHTDVEGAVAGKTRPLPALTARQIRRLDPHQHPTHHPSLVAHPPEGLHGSVDESRELAQSS